MAFAVLLSVVSVHSVPWSVALHGGEIKHNASLAPTVVELTTRLGAVGVRMDIFWDEIQPLENETLCHGGDAASRCAFYSEFFRSAVTSGLKVTPILSSPPAWAKNLVTRDEKNTTAFLGAWHAYVCTAMSLIGDAGAFANGYTRHSSFHEVNIPNGIQYGMRATCSARLYHCSRNHNRHTSYISSISHLIYGAIL